MNPRKARVGYDQVSELCGIPKEQVQTINNFYWGAVRRDLSSLVNPTITLIGLGEMKVKHWNIDPTIHRLTNKVKRWESTVAGENPIFDSYTTDLAKVVRLKELIDIETKKKTDNKIKRIAYDV